MNVRLMDWISAMLSAIAGVATLAGALFFKDQLPLSRGVARGVGFPVLYGGMALFLWAGFHLRAAIGGRVAPRLQRLVITGPFRIIRHPAYVGLTLALIGAALVTRSAVGMLAVILLFLPVEIHRARLEEGALHEKFGPAWRAYAARTGFFLPWFGRRNA